MNLDELEQHLLEILEQTHQRQQSVLELLDQQHQAMIERDLTRLSGIATELVGRAQELQGLEQQRAAVTRQITEMNEGLGENPSLQEIAILSPEPNRRDLFRDIRESLLHTQEQVTSARDRNQSLASNIVEANDDTLRNLMSTLRESGYSPEDTPRVVDRRA
ncbi:MAG: flagellar export chaperone FlgN [Thermomicrobiales bacterium]